MPLWLVIDLEATTDEGGWPLAEMEVIEIGAVIVNDQGIEHDHLQRYIKPIRRPLLTSFCRDLTHIKQADISASATFDKVWPEVEQWFLPYQQRLVGWASWGDYDKLQLSQQWQALNLTSHLQHLPHHNLKAGFAASQQLIKPVGLKRALQLAGLSFQGQQHRALSDARNTARLLPLTQVK